ncbi:hypothetical protein ACQUFY_10895 [Robbsia andropogonis]|uniref:hypothetical protein n=1 Tax=Robbsia andropogonis TaxID=28092 RepID=UPI003D261824
MTFRNFYLALTKEQREAFAVLAGTTEKYIAVKLVRAAAVPRPAQMERLWEACLEFKAPFSRSDLLHFFYPESHTRPTTSGDALLPPGAAL